LINPICASFNVTTESFLFEQGLKGFVSNGVLAVDFASDLSSLIDVNMVSAYRIVSSEYLAYSFIL
jgi:hypothetical protein